MPQSAYKTKIRRPLKDRGVISPKPTGITVVVANRNEEEIVHMSKKAIVECCQNKASGIF